jgi:hypothetical protein
MVTATPSAPRILAPALEEEPSAVANSTGKSARADARPMFDGAPTCSECGMLMTPNGACYKCENCGGTSGCS